MKSKLNNDEHAHLFAQKDAVDMDSAPERESNDSSAAHASDTADAPAEEALSIESPTPAESAEDSAHGIVVSDVDLKIEPFDASSDRVIKILIVHASVGSGHRSAALAIAQAFDLINQDGGDDGRHIDVEVLDILDFGRIVFDGDNTASMFTGATRPIYDLTWRYTFTGRFLWGGGTIWARIMYPKFVEYVKEVQPDAIICTHITAANVAVSARMLTDRYFPIICVPTDYEVEGLWPHLYTDLFCVADDRMAETLRPRKVPEKRIKITGIPTKPNFNKLYDKEEVRKSLGLPDDKQIVLFLAGATLPRPYVHFRKAIDELMPYMHTFKDMHFVIVAGKDEDYGIHLRTEVADYRLSNVTVYDFVEDMPALMSACNLVVCKSGGLTVTECLCCNVPMILLGKAYGQEKANVNTLTGAGAAFHVTTARELLDLLYQIEEHPKATQAILLNASFIRRPNAAMDIAEATLDAIKGDPSIDERLTKKHFMHFYWGGKPAHIR